MKLWIDLETFSATPLKHGTHAYAQSAEVLLCAWALDDAPVQVWDLSASEGIPVDLYTALRAGPQVWAHNSHFDRTVLAHALPSLCPALPRWRDTMVQALSHGLPGKLALLCELLQVPRDQAKDKRGRQLIDLFCKPRPASSTLRRASRTSHPEEWQQFVAYAGQDVAAMRAVHQRLPLWNYPGRELALWHLDQTINDRGVAIDLALVDAAIAAVNQAQTALACQTLTLSQGELTSTTQVAKLLQHIAACYRVTLPDLQMATLERRLHDPGLPAGLKALLAIRLQASTSSTAKYKTLRQATSADGRLRGTLQFNGAARTGRWAGRLFQPQNLPRPVLSQAVIDAGITALKAGCAELTTDNVMELTSSAIRSCLIAPPGKKLVVADLSNIEGRGQAWLAGETWKLQAFRDFDAGSGHDLYKLAYSKSFGILPENVSKAQRQIGKVQELALGYAGGVGAFVTFAGAYSIDLEALAPTVLAHAPAWAIEQAHDFYDWTCAQHRPSFELSREAFVACETLKRSWRMAHSRIASYWSEIEHAVLSAVHEPGTTRHCRTLKIRRDGNWLRLGLPSGRALCYPAPATVDGTLTCMGLNPYSRQWARLNTYGGKIFENACQAVARDVMAHNLAAIEAAGYQIVLSVHDEVICEAPDTGDFTATHLSALLAAPPPWAPDMPLAAAGFESYVYKKD
jgi:DNA polymerase